MKWENNVRIWIQCRINIFHFLLLFFQFMRYLTLLYDQFSSVIVCVIIFDWWGWGKAENIFYFEGTEHLESGCENFSRFLGVGDEVELIYDLRLLRRDWRTVIKKKCRKHIKINYQMIMKTKLVIKMQDGDDISHSY